MKLCKRLLCLLLSMALLLGLTTAPVWADDATPISGSSSIVNPRYPDVGIPETPYRQLPQRSHFLPVRHAVPDIFPIGRAARRKCGYQMRDRR